MKYSDKETELRLESPRIKTDFDKETGSRLTKGKFSGGKEGGYYYHFETQIDGRNIRADFEVVDATSAIVYHDMPFLVRERRRGLGLEDLIRLTLERATRKGRSFIVQDILTPDGDISTNDMMAVVNNFVICFFAISSSFYNNAPEPMNTAEKFYPDTLEFRSYSYPGVNFGMYSAVKGRLDV